MSTVPALFPFLNTVLYRIMGQPQSVPVIDPMVMKLMEQMYQQNLQNMENFRASEARFEALIQSMKEKKHTSFDELEANDAQLAHNMIQVAKQTEAMRMEGKNYGFFGDTNSGKSTLLNTLLGRGPNDKNAARTGRGECTRTITPFKGPDFHVWDIPGSNDEINYLSLSYVSCMKGLSKRGILVVSTIKEQTKLINLLKKLDLPFFLIVNKIDELSANEVDTFKAKILGERDTYCPDVPVFFVSAKKKDCSASEWTELLLFLTKADSGYKK
jgi:small GTP-binding protein